MLRRLSPLQLAVAGAALTVVLILVAVAALTGGEDDSPVAGPASSRQAPDDVLDELFPDRRTPAADAPATATPDPAGSTDVASSLLTEEVLWAPNAFGELDVVVLVRNDATEAFANVTVSMAVLGTDGQPIEQTETALARVDPGHLVPVTAQVAVDAASVANVVVDVRGRGSLPARSPARIEGVDWRVDDAGTVVVSGTISSDELVEFAAVVAVLRDSGGGYQGFAFAFVDGIGPDPRPFEATGFPVGQIASVEVHATA